MMDRRLATWLRRARIATAPGAERQGRVKVALLHKRCREKEETTKMYKERSLSKSFKKGYPILFIAKCVALASCIFGVFVMTKDFQVLTIEAIIGLATFVITKIRFSETLDNLASKEELNNIEWFLIFVILLIAIMILVTEAFIHPPTVKSATMSLIAGFTGGITISEYEFLRRYSK